MSQFWTHPFFQGSLGKANRSSVSSHYRVSLTYTIVFKTPVSLGLRRAINTTTKNFVWSLCTRLLLSCKGQIYFRFFTWFPKGFCMINVLSVCLTNEWIFLSTVVVTVCEATFVRRSFLRMQLYVWVAGSR